MAHQGESFHPFLSLQGLSLSPSLVLHCLSCFLSRMPEGAPKLCGSPAMAPVPGFYILAGIFLCNPISDSSPNWLHVPALRYFPACQWPCDVGRSISKLSRRSCTQEELPPSYVRGPSHSHLPGSKHGHSYLTYL